MITEQSQATTPAASGSESDDLENELESRPQAQAAKSLSDTITIAFNGLKSDFAQEYLDFCDEDSDIDEEVELEMLCDEVFACKLAKMAQEEDDKDTDWIPARARVRRGQSLKEAKKKSRPKTYQKGPDVMSKSKRTQQRYRKQFQNQSSLNAFGFLTKKTVAGGLTVTISEPVSDGSGGLSSAVAAGNSNVEATSVASSNPRPFLGARTASALSDPASSSSESEARDSGESFEPAVLSLSPQYGAGFELDYEDRDELPVDTGVLAVNDSDLEDDEDGLDETVQPRADEI